MIGIRKFLKGKSFEDFLVSSLSFFIRLDEIDLDTVTENDIQLLTPGFLAFMESVTPMRRNILYELGKCYSYGPTYLLTRDVAKRVNKPVYTISVTLNELYNNGVLKRKLKSGGRGGIYYAYAIKHKHFAKWLVEQQKDTNIQ